MLIEYEHKYINYIIHYYIKTHADTERYIISCSLHRSNHGSWKCVTHSRFAHKKTNSIYQTNQTIISDRMFVYICFHMNVFINDMYNV